VNLRNLRRAAHEAIDILIDAIEADLRADDADASAVPPRRKARRVYNPPPPDPSKTTPELIERMSRRG
jgi:hypothetical protein